MIASYRPKRRIIPPVWFALGVIAVFLLDRYFPFVEFHTGFGPTAGNIGVLLGIALILHGVYLAASSARLFAKSGTGIVPFSEATTLVTAGAFRHSRNPMYAGMVLALLGAAFLLGSISAMLVAPVFALIIQLRFILHEEQMMRDVFGEEYEKYCEQVRRWF